MTEPPSGSNVGIDLIGRGDIDMWTGRTRAVGEAVLGVSQDLSSSVPGLLEKIADARRAISENITTWDEVSKAYKEQEDTGIQEFADAVDALPRRVGDAAAGSFRAVDQYLANEAEMARIMRNVPGSSSGPEPNS